MIDVENVSDMDWSGQGRTSPVDCWVMLTIIGSTSEAFAHQGPVVVAAASHGFDVERVVVSRAQSSADYHRMHMAQSSDDESPSTVMSALELSIRHPGPVADAATALQAFLADAPNDLELVKASVGSGGEYDGNHFVVVG